MHAKPDLRVEFEPNGHFFRLGDLCRYLPKPNSMLNQYWKREFGDSPPIAHQLRSSFPKRWVRFHSLPDSQRYPNTDGEMDLLLARHNSILCALSVNDNELQLLTTNCSPDSTHDLPDQLVLETGISSSPWLSVPMHEIETDPDPNYWHIFHAAINWMPNVFNDVLRLVANDQIGNVMIVDPTKSWLYHPYDGGADVILKSASERDDLAIAFQSWLSPRTDGM